MDTLVLLGGTVANCPERGNTRERRDVLTNMTSRKRDGAGLASRVSVKYVLQGRRSGETNEHTAHRRTIVYASN